MPWRVAWAMQHIERQIADLHLIAVMQPAIGREGSCTFNAILRADIGCHVDPELIIRMRAFDRHAEIGRKHAGEAAMIDMTVGDEQLFDGDTVLGRDGHKFVEIAARIGEGAAHCLGAPEQRAILLQRGDGYDDSLKRGFGCFVHAA